MNIIDEAFGFRFRRLGEEAFVRPEAAFLLDFRE
jgi:hypothetical protein